MAGPDDIWVGARYKVSNPRILILGESVYGSGDRLEPYLRGWISGKKDYTFARIFNAFSGFRTSPVDPIGREAFWEKFVFYNFVVRLMETRKCRPRIQDYLESRATLLNVLKHNCPHGVVILGKEQGRYSEPTMEEYGCVYVTMQHPAARGIKTEELKGKWTELQAKIRNRHPEQSPAT
jgi:hypothetical protein